MIKFFNDKIFCCVSYLSEEPLSPVQILIQCLLEAAVAVLFPAGIVLHSN